MKFPTSVSQPTRKKSRSYKERKKADLLAWEKLRPAFLHAYIEGEAPPLTPTCSQCGDFIVSDKIYMCNDCHVNALFCHDCVDEIHRVCKLHVIKHWQGGTYIEASFCQTKTYLLQPHECCKSKYTKLLSLIDSKGRIHNNCVLHFCECESECVILLRHGFWPVSPKLPQVAVSTELLEWYQYLTLEAQVSAQAFVNVLKYKEGNVIGKSTTELVRILKGESLYEYRNFSQTCKTYPQKESTALQCPACPEENGNIYVSMDANFGLVHKKNSGDFQDKSSLSEAVFLPQGQVDAHVDTYGDQSKKGGGECSTFQAGSTLRAKSRTVKLNYTGVFAGACRHEVPLRMMNIRHGERIAYPMFFLDWLVQSTQGKSLKVFVLYDIACVLQSHIRKKQRTDLEEYFRFAIPIFHCYGHKGDCRVFLNPRRLEGFGLTDGEQLERFWSYLRQFSKITKEQTPGHRDDLLTLAVAHFTMRKTATMEKYLVERMTKAESMEATAAKDLERILMEHQSISVLDEALSQDDLLKHWREAEAATFSLKKNVQHLTDSDDYKEKYGVKLAAFYSLRSQITLMSAKDDLDVDNFITQMNRIDKELKVMEKKFRIKARWQNNDSEYQKVVKAREERKKLQILFKMRTLSVDRLYIQEARKRYSDGQALSKRLTKSMKRASSALSNQMKLYNDVSFVSEDDDLPNNLAWEAVANPDSALYRKVEEKLYIDDDGTDLIATSTRRQALEAASLLARAKEEKELLSTEVLHLLKHFTKLHTDLTVLLRDVMKESKHNRYSQGLQSILRSKLARLEEKLIGIKYTVADIGMEVTDIPAEHYLHFNPDKLVVPPYGYDVDDDESDSDVDYESDQSAHGNANDANLEEDI